MARRARGLARVLDVPSACFDARERQAYHILAHASGMPAVPDHGQRHRYGLEVLQNADRLMPLSDPSNGSFFQHLDGLVATMQELPWWYEVLTASNDKVVNDYLVTRDIIIGMQLVGFGSAGAGAVGGVTRSGVQGAVRAAGSGFRASGAGLVRGMAAGAGKAFTGGAAGALGVIWVVGWFALTALQAQNHKLGQEITRRYQERKLSPDLYQKAFGKDLALPERYFYPVR